MFVNDATSIIYSQNCASLSLFRKSLRLIKPVSSCVPALKVFSIHLPEAGSRVLMNPQLCVPLLPPPGWTQTAGASGTSPDEDRQARRRGEAAADSSPSEALRSDLWPPWRSGWPSTERPGPTPSDWCTETLQGCLWLPR